MSFSQISYAQDSLVVITKAQLKQTNLLFNKLEMLEQLDSINYLKIRNLEESNTILKDNLESLELGLTICDSKNQELIEENDILKSNIKKARRAIIGSSAIWISLFALLALL
jgi:hypothetical protein